MLGRVRVRVILAAVFLAALALLHPGVAPHIADGDSAELALAGETLGVAHPPGYPVFAVIHKAIGTAIPFGNPAFRQNMASCSIMAGALALLGGVLILLSGVRWSGFLPLLLLFSPQVRHQAFVAEVFPLAAFWAALLIYATVRFGRRREGVYLIAFLTGIGWGVHQVLALLLPGLIFYWAVAQPRPVRALAANVLPIAFFGLLGLSVFLYLPVRSHADPVLDWENPDSWDRFWGVFTRARYGFFRLSQGAGEGRFTAENLFASFYHGKNHLFRNLGWSGAALLVFGSLRALAQSRHRRFLGAAWLMILFSGPFFFWMAGIPAGAATTVLDRFTLIPLVPSFLLTALGLALIWNSPEPAYKFLTFLFLSAFVLELSWRVGGPVPGGRPADFSTVLSHDGDSHRWDLSLRSETLNVLRAVREEAVLLTDRADEIDFGLAYLLGAERRRPGVRFIDCNAGLTPNIYGEGYHRIWGRQRLAIRERVESRLIRESEAPVYYATKDPLMVNIYRTPRGLVFRAWELSEYREPTTIAWNRIFDWRFRPQSDRALVLARDNAMRLGRALFDGGLVDEATEAFGQAQKWGGVNRWEKTGYWLQVRGRRRDARKAYMRALKGAAVTETLYSNLGALEMESGEVGNAVLTLQAGVRRFPDSVPLRYNLGAAYWRKGDRENAVRQWTRVLALDPNHLQAAQWLERVRPAQAPL